MNKKLISTISACGSIMTYSLSITVLGPILDTLQNVYQVSSGQIGMLFTALSGGFFASTLSKSSLLRLVNIKITFLFAQLLISLSLGIFPLAKNLLQALTLFSLVGFAGGLIQIASNTEISLLHTERRVSMLNVLHLFFGIGALSGPLLAGFMFNQNWKFIFWILSGFSIFIFTLQIFSEYPQASVIKVEKISAFFLLKDKLTWFLMLSTLLYIGAEMGINSWAVIFLQKEHSLSKILASSFLSYFWFFMTFGRLLGIYLASRFSTSLLLLIFSILAFFSGGIFFFGNNGIISGVGLAFIGFFFSGTYPFLIGLGGSKHPQALEETTTLLVGAAAIGFMIFPWLTGVIGDIASLKVSIAAIWGLIFLLVLSSGAIFYWDKESRN